MLTTGHLIALSDVHIAPPGPRQAFTGMERLCALLAQRVLPHTTLVLGGDIFDLLHAADRTDRLDWQDAPRLFRDFLRDLGADGVLLFDALGEALRRGARIILMPGNHDAELYHPDCLAVLGQQITAQHSDAPLDRLWLHTASTLELRVGSRAVTVAHGHSQDPWNRISEELLKRAQNSERPLLPPGSRLVLRVMAPLQLDEEQRFPFLDKLKPESPLFFLLLVLSIDWKLFGKLAKTFGLSAEALIDRLRSLFSAPALSGTHSQQPATLPDDGEALGIALAQALATALPPGPERNIDAQAVERWIRGHEPERIGAGTLPAYLGRRIVWKALLNGARSKRFFDQSRLGAEDRALLAAYTRRPCTAPAAAQKVFITGHTHAARTVQTPEGIHYINTGTWSHLLPFGIPLSPESATAAHDGFRDFRDIREIGTWVDQLRANELRDYDLYHYAEVDESEAVLRMWPSKSPFM